MLYITLLHRYVHCSCLITISLLQYSGEVKCKKHIIRVDYFTFEVFRTLFEISFSYKYLADAIRTCFTVLFQNVCTMSSIINKRVKSQPRVSETLIVSAAWIIHIIGLCGAYNCISPDNSCTCSWNMLHAN